jgi:hypothetical protein
MRKIIHIANFNLVRLKGCFQVGFPFKISNGLIRNGYSVFNYPDRDICRMFGFGHMNWFAKKKLNKHLINYCRVMEPDALFIGHADLIEEDTILKIKDMFPNLKVLQWSCDWIHPEMAQRNISSIKSKINVADVNLISTGDKTLLKQFKTDTNKVGYVPNMSDDSLEVGRAFEQENLPYDILLCANTGRRQFCGQDEEIEKIVDDSISHVEGLRWKLAGIKNTPTLNGFEYLRAIQETAMGLNLSRLNDIYLYSSDRMIHSFANGQLVFIDTRNGFQDIFSDKEAVFYTTKEEFYDKLSYYKNNPQERMKIAQAGHKKAHTEFSNVAVTKYMADILFDETFKPQKNWQIII